MKLRSAAFITGVALAAGSFSFGTTIAPRGGPDSRNRPEVAFSRAQRQATHNCGAGNSSGPLLRVVTYNIHSSKGLDSRVKPDRIADILRRIDADVIALQEVRAEQAEEIARRLGFHLFYGRADIVHGYDFGNAILSRFTIRETHLYAIGVPHRQQRACLRADIAWPGGAQTLHVFTTHLGLAGAERREQAARLASPEILEDPSIQEEPRVFLGDFNEKNGHGAVNKRLSPLLRRLGKDTWPGLLPFIDLDRIYISREMRPVSVRHYRKRAALIASDHVPLVAELEEIAAAPEETAR
jgi:endonuclease/exonuclease/phosphatase family metal-dependent hydrolase